MKYLIKYFRERSYHETQIAQKHGQFGAWVVGSITVVSNSGWVVVGWITVGSPGPQSGQVTHSARIGLLFCPGHCGFHSTRCTQRCSVKSKRVPQPHWRAI